MNSRKALIAFVILSLVAVAFPPKTHWTRFYDGDCGEYLCEATLDLHEGHEMIEVTGGNPANRSFLQDSHTTWEPIWKPDDRSNDRRDARINTTYLTLEILLAFCLVLVPAFNSTKTRAGAVAVAVVTAVILVPVGRHLSGRPEDPTVRAQRLRANVYETILLDVMNHLSTRGSGSGSVLAADPRSGKYRDALACLDAITASDSLTIKDVLDSETLKPIRVLLDFYLVTMGCVDQMIFPRYESEMPMLAALFFDSKGKLIGGIEEQFDICTFGASGSERSFVRIDKVKAATLQIPISWLREDAQLMLLREGTRSGASSERAELLKTLEAVASSRSWRPSALANSSDSRIDKVLLDLRAMLGGR